MTARRLLAHLVVCAFIVAAGCAKNTGSSGPASPEPSPSAAVSAQAVAVVSAAASPGPQESGAAGASPGASPGATATPLATPTPEPNLLTRAAGTIVRTYPVADTDPEHAAEHGYTVSEGDNGPWVFVYELSGPAALSRVTAQLPAKDPDGKNAVSVTFAVSTSGAATGFSDAGTLVSTTTDAVQTLPLKGTPARWVRVTASGANHAPIEGLAAYGTFTTTPAASRIDGTYVQYDNPYGKGAFNTAPDVADPWYIQVTTAGANGVNGLQCFSRHLGDAYPGVLDGGRRWHWQRSNAQGDFAANEEGTMVVATGYSAAYYVRVNTTPLYCAPQYQGTGSNNVLVLDSPAFPSLYPTNAEAAKAAPKFRFAHIGAPLVDQRLLDRSSTVILNGLCTADDFLNAAQNQAIAQWVQNGHKLLIYDADMCGTPTHYALLPYQFESNNPGAHGAKGDRLIQVEDDSLGSSDKTDKAHFFDPAPWVLNANQLGDANTVTTHDPHWCGHLFGTNANHVNGFMQMYTTYGAGLIVFDGFDHDDGDNPSYQRVRMLELEQPVPADLPCSQKASLAFVIEPNRDASFVPGKAATLPFSMELLANQGWKGHVNLTTSGDFKGRVNPGSIDVNGGTQPLKIAVSIPASAKAGSYAVIVNGDGGGGQTAQATIQLHAAVPMVKQLKQQRRIRIYGIHFDVDKATIKPQSEPVVAEIAQLMKQNPSFRFRVEGHTDSDGGFAHNQVLSQHRAESVVNDLVKRYHIAKSRLVPKGFGYSKPVAPNTTPAGKALNRRVELFLLSGT